MSSVGGCSQQKPYVNLKKWSFLYHKAVFLGFVASTDGLQPDPEKVQAIKDWSVPQSIANATIHGQCLYWLASFYMRFHVCVCNKYQKFSAIMSSITECLEGVDFQWSKSAQRAFEHIKTLMTEAPVTALLYFGKFFLWSGIGHIGELVYRCFWWV